jgi:hypothetical protein
VPPGDAGQTRHCQSTRTGRDCSYALPAPRLNQIDSCAGASVVLYFSGPIRHFSPYFNPPSSSPATITSTAMLMITGCHVVLAASVWPAPVLR